jgi:hypothetical protein
MKVDLELIIQQPDGRKFLNRCDYLKGNDICCEIIDGKLFKSEYDDEGNVLPKKEISFTEFIQLIEQLENE